jgi:hypothetical protein
MLEFTQLDSYECKICGLIHFPEPLTKCPRERNNKEHLARERRVREGYLNEFKAVVKRCTDEHGKVQWNFVDRAFRNGKELVTLIPRRPARAK